MSKVPRASISISILTDEDFTTVMGSEGGLEAFGVFTALIVAARQRLQEKRVRQLSGTDSLVFEDSRNHVALVSRVPADRIDAALEVFGRVAKANGSKPWIYLDRAGHLVIRSFFKFNASPTWGGPRPGSGRPSETILDSISGNQDEIKSNQDDSPPIPIPIPIPNPHPVECEGIGEFKEPGPKAKPPDPTPVPPPPPQPAPAFERIGQNRPDQVERTFRVVQQHYPADTNVWTWCQQWLHDKPASRVCELLIMAKGKNNPSRWIQTVINQPEPGRTQPSDGPPPERIPFSTNILRAAPDSKIRIALEKLRAEDDARREAAG